MLIQFNKIKSLISINKNYYKDRILDSLKNQKIKNLQKIIIFIYTHKYCNKKQIKID